MNTPTKILIVLAVAGLVAGAVLLKKGSAPKATSTGSAQALATALPVAAKPLLRLLDLGADKCIPCKRMSSILVELK